ncbi:hypothetical protein PRK78_004384 [Emydomyces testavorans]|uniref:NADH dehydrogenase [ubiquinone] 1 alpha subcomplex assembly factor 3 n=1 Tax=Emydomyces testavorans TaxID=2070801 RepID=A0AAF0IJQ0_9EURO|nr:hypothetical protein PRK78_004384 [Emydomyces testavorans]
MRSPSTQLLRVLRAFTASSPKTNLPRTRLRQCPVSHHANPTIPCSRTITSTAVVCYPETSTGSKNSSSSRSDNGSRTDNNKKFPLRSPSPRPVPTQRRTELTTADLKPKSRYRGPPPPEDPQTDTSIRTDLNALDIFTDVAAPSTAIDACLHDGFHLNNGLKISGGDGCLLVDGEVFAWRPWEAGKKGGKAAMVNDKGQWEVGEDAWGVLGLMWPKPDLLILGLGGTVRPISPETRRHINQLGIRIEIQDTRNAAAQFNLLATERGVREVAAALIPVGWKG